MEKRREYGRKVKVKKREEEIKRGKRGKKGRKERRRET